MAVFKFVGNILSGLPIEVFGHGTTVRDYTYVDDVVRAVIALSDVVPVVRERAGGAHDTLSAVAPYRIVNIGGNKPVGLMELISEIERATGCRAIRKYVATQTGDVPRTEASSELLQALIKFSPTTPLDVGISKFVTWYRNYHEGKL
jgi:UDP-glucuronate 4-epimerase